MCGIIGYTGPRQVLPVLLDGLKRLEYRGYDSAGVAVLGPGGLCTERCKGRVEELCLRTARGLPGSLGIGHTRWATHGAPSDANAHPHLGCAGGPGVAVVHNGIIENYLALKAELVARGHRFSSETDTEVIPHLLEEELRAGPRDLSALARAVRAVAARLRGAYALAVIWDGAPEGLVAVRQDSPLILGHGQGETYLASDIPALLPHTREVTVLENGDLAVVRSTGTEVSGLDGLPRQRRRLTLDMPASRAELGNYRHFMEKEIFEQPQAMREALRGRLGGDGEAFELPEMAALAEIAVPPSRPGWPRRVCLVACGTAYNAGLLARGWLEGLARLDSSADIASEFRYRRPLLDAQDLLVAISQSGETADTLGALREGRRSGAAVLGVVNVVGSSVARESDAVLYTRAGPEIAVASTKAYVTQLVVLGLITLELARRAERLPEAALFEAVEALRALPGLAQRSLELVPQVEEFAAELAGAHDVFYIGRGLDFPVCLEAQLKLKELSYLHAEAYPAGELKHGTLALIEEGVPVIAVITQPGLCEKTLSNVREVEARGGRVTAVVSENLAPAVAPHVARVLAVPATLPWLAPMLAIIPLQLLAYHVARLRGCDVDKPRNLAKSVTVE